MACIVYCFPFETKDIFFRRSRHGTSATSRTFIPKQKYKFTSRTSSRQKFIYFSSGYLSNEVFPSTFPSTSWSLDSHWERRSCWIFSRSFPSLLFSLADLRCFIFSSAASFWSTRSVVIISVYLSISRFIRVFSLKINIIRDEWKIWKTIKIKMKNMKKNYLAVLNILYPKAAVTCGSPAIYVAEFFSSFRLRLSVSFWQIFWARIWPFLEVFWPDFRCLHCMTNTNYSNCDPLFCHNRQRYHSLEFSHCPDD